LESLADVLGNDGNDDANNTTHTHKTNKKRDFVGLNTMSKEKREFVGKERICWKRENLLG